MTSLPYSSAQELAGLVRCKKISPLEILEETFKRIRAVNPAINAFVALRVEEAMEEARGLTECIASGKKSGPLAGVPIGVKDLEDVKGMVTSFGSTPFKGNIARVRTSRPIDGQKNFKGTLSGITGGYVKLLIGEKMVTIPYREVTRARLVNYNGDN